MRKIDGKGLITADKENHPKRRRTDSQGYGLPHSVGTNGLKIKNVCIVMMMISAVIYVLLMLKSVQLQSNYTNLSTSTTEYFAASDDARSVNEASDYLTEQVRMFSIELNRIYADNYFREAKVRRRRERALENLKTRPVGTDTFTYFNKAIRYSNELMDTEYYAMRLIVEAVGYRIDSFPAELQDTKLTAEDAALPADAKIWKARAMLFDSSYQQHKDMIRRNLALSYTTVMEAMNDIQRHNAILVTDNMFQQKVCITALFILTLLIFGAIIVLVVNPLNKYMENIRAGRMLDLNGAYEFRYLASTYNSIFERNMTNQELLRHKAEHDFLTGLMNRGSFADISDMLRDNTNDLAMVLVDVDVFKQINDKYGHATGDKILQKVSKLLLGVTRSSDSVFRLGGDEFGIIMTYITTSDKSAIAEKFNSINDAMQHPMDGLPICSISVGVAFSSVGYRDALYLNADKALYQVKRSQRGGVNFYQEVLE
ncbi:MAG: GGDEF domain-containing protein [Schwartzia sp.]|nr:GGDEF domain-containing protein [Schwartzia sp. (in: firmicutes)]